MKLQEERLVSSKQATLHMLCGKIASGKSTLAAELDRLPDTLLISEDQLLTRLYPGEILTLDDYRRCAMRLREAIGPLITRLLRAGMSVILDFQANTPTARAWMRGLFEAANAHHELHVLPTSDDLCKERLHARNAAGSHEYHVSEAEFDLFTSFFVPPAKEESFNIVIHESC